MFNHEQKSSNMKTHTEVKDFIKYLDERTRWTWEDSTYGNDCGPSVRDKYWGVKIMLPNSFINDEASEMYNTYTIVIDEDSKLWGEHDEYYADKKYDKFEDVVEEINDLIGEIEDELHLEAKVYITLAGENCSLDEIDIEQFSAHTQSKVKDLLERFRNV